MKYFEIKDYHNTQIISTSELKEHLRITFNDDDNYIVDLEKAAVRRLEEFTNLFLLGTTGIQYGNTFKDLEILFKSPLYNIKPDLSTKVSYKTALGWQIIPANQYELVYSMKPSRVYKSSSFIDPPVIDVFEAWKIDYRLGYTSIAEIPSPIKQAIKIMVSDMYENRQSVIVGKIVSEIPKTAQYLMNPFKILTL